MLYTFVFNLLLGVVLLGLFPKFSDRVADRVATDPVRTGLAGLGIFVAIPILLVVIAITVIGIPISILGLLLFLLVVWIRLVYGRFAIGYWLLSRADIDSRWGGLKLGLVLAAVLQQIPIIGRFVNFVIFLLALGALVTGLYTRRRRIESVPDTAPEETPAE